MKTRHSTKDKFWILLKYFQLFILRQLWFTKSKLRKIRYKKYILNGHAFDSLYFLFGEIFVRNEYYFETNQRDLRILDCGSNIGASVLFFKIFYPKSNIIAFEPDPNTFRILKENIRNNHLENVTVYNKAVGGESGKKKFYIEHCGSLSMSLSKNRGKGSSILVNVVPLSNYISETIDFVKIDIEGAELEVLIDLDLHKKYSLIKSGVIECHHNINNTQSIFGTIINILEKNGYKYQLDGQNIPVTIKNRFQDILVYFYRD